MGFLDTLGKIGSAVSPFVGAASAGVGLLTNTSSKLTKQQKELMDYQNSLNRANTAYANELTRQNMADQYVLNRAGMKRAGINTAFGDGSSQVAGVSGTSVPSTTTPSALPTDAQTDSQYMSMLNGGVDTLTKYLGQRASIDVANQQAENMRLDNLTKLQRDLADLTEKRANARSSEARSQYERLYWDTYQRYAKENAQNDAKRNSNDTYMSDIDAHYANWLKSADLQQVLADVELKLSQKDLNEEDRKYYEYRKRIAESEISKNKASAADSLSHVGVNTSTARLNNANSDVVERGTEDTLAILKSERVRKWYDAQPKGIQEVIMSSKGVRLAVDKLQNGNELDTGDWTALGAALGYEKAGALVEVVKSAAAMGKPKPKISIVKHLSTKK